MLFILYTSFSYWGCENKWEKVTVISCSGRDLQAFWIQARASCARWTNSSCTFEVLSISDSTTASLAQLHPAKKFQTLKPNFFYRVPRTGNRKKTPKKHGSITVITFNAGISNSRLQKTIISLGKMPKVR